MMPFTVQPVRGDAPGRYDYHFWLTMRSHTEKLRVRWVDTDASGRIHYTAAFRYFETAEWELMRQAGFPLSDHRKISGLPRVNVSATFHAPLYVDEPIAVKVWVERIGTTSITFAGEIYREEERCVSGAITAVFVDHSERPQPIPDAIREALTGDEGRLGR